MNIAYNLTGDRRKALVKAISEFLEINAIYNGAPSFSYTVGVYTIDRNGTVSFPDHCSRELAYRLVTALEARGFHAETDDTADNCAPALPESEELGRDRRDPQGEDGPRPGDIPCADEEDNRLTIDMPLTGFTEAALENLKNLVASKSQLILKALGTNSLRIHRSEDKLRFPWFMLTGADGEMDAYLRFVIALCKMARSQKRVMARERDEENEKLAMRLFLVRLGFVGPEFKAARAILLRNLTGNSAWKHGAPPPRAPDDAPSNNVVETSVSSGENTKGGSTL